MYRDKKKYNIDVLAFSCRRKNNKWVVAMDKWQKMTDMEVNQGKEIHKIL